MEKPTLENTEKTEVHPLEATGMLFEVAQYERKLLESVGSVELELPNVKTWSLVSNSQ